jgi:lipopolysaccharide/colanic/teichoic acid biosynthesis glycosyltransferase
MKRTFDLTLCILGLMVIWPVLLVIMILIRRDGGKTVFFRQLRIGKNGNPFLIWKFRTMVEDAESLGKQLTVGDDPRITRIGYWLRKTKLDELPQLFNILSGEMSFVGPRPEVPKYVELYTEEQKQVLNLLPGITDLASIEYRDESNLLAESSDPEKTYIEEIMPEKIRINLEYCNRSNVLTDLMVILKTLFRVFIKRG